MTVQNRALIRLVKHLAISMGIILVVYLLATSLPVDIFIMILGAFGVAFFGYQIFKIYVTIEELEETRKKSVDNKE